MRSALVIAAMASTALGLSIRQSDDGGITFEVPGASEERGFQIPEGVPDGAYIIKIDDSGVAHFTSVDVPQDLEVPDVTSPAAEEHDTSPALVSRADWVITCGDGRDLNRAQTDEAVRILKVISGNWDDEGGIPLWPGEKLVVTKPSVVAYCCNYDSQIRHCKSWEVESELQRRASSRCGAYKSGCCNDIHR